MATISSPGIGTQLDVKSIVTSLVDLEKRPLDALKLQAATVQTKISAFGQIKSQVSALSDAASTLSSLTTYNSVNATSSNTSVVTATAIGGTAAASRQRASKASNWGRKGRSWAFMRDSALGFDSAASSHARNRPRPARNRTRAPHYP